VIPTRTAVHAIVLAVALRGFASSTGTPPDGSFDVWDDLAVLHPELVRRDDYKAWSSGSPLGSWRQVIQDGRRGVLVQKAGAPTAAAVFGGEIIQTADGPRLEPFVRTGPQVEASFELFGLANRASRAKEDVTDAKAGGNFVPTLIFRDGTIDLSWKVVSPPTPSPPNQPTPRCGPGEDDAMSANELHHKDDPVFCAEACNITKNVTDPHEKARLLLTHVFLTVEYESLSEYRRSTFPDRYVKEKASGECDEKAVLLVSYLRCVGIRARMKFLKWEIRKGPKQHACVEYTVNGVTCHLDPTLDLFQSPENYRLNPNNTDRRTKIVVVDVDWPSDSRASVSPDVSDNDGLLDPWNDFCYTPDRAGEPRRGYSDP